MSANETLAQATQPSTTAPAATTQASWRERANSELEKVVQLFSSKQLPDLCAKALINSPAKPSSKWSFGNQILMLLAGTSDARGFRQWNEAERWVAKGAKAFWILGPVRKKVKTSKEVPGEQGEEGEGFREVLIGFKAIPVFRYEDTFGQDLPAYEPRSIPPLMDVAESFGMKVQYERLAPGVYGATDHTGKTITLATEDWDTFFHELAHSLHRTFEPKTGLGQEPEAETIAQLVAATLSRLYERPADNFSWNYIAAYAASDKNPQQVGRACMRVLDRTKKVLNLIYSPNEIQPAYSNPYLNGRHLEEQPHGT